MNQDDIRIYESGDRFKIVSTSYGQAVIVWQSGSRHCREEPYSNQWLRDRTAPLYVLRALSMTPPFGQKVRDRIKTIETRKYGTDYRGPILFCCAKEPPSPEAGQSLCIAHLVDIRPMTTDDEEAACVQLYPKARAWLLEDVVPITPFPVKGQQGFFTIELPYVQAKEYEQFLFCKANPEYAFARTFFEEKTS